MSTGTGTVVAWYGHQRPPRRVMLRGPAGITVLALIAWLISGLARPAPGHSTVPFDRVVQRTDTAVSDLNFNLTGNGAIECSEAGCEITVNVISQVTSTTPRTKIVGGQVTANLTVDVEVEGQSASGCTSTDVLPLNGTKQLRCQDLQASPIISQLLAQKKAQAEAESRAAGGASIPYSVSYGGSYLVEGLAEVDVLREGQQPSREQVSSTCPIETIAGSCDPTTQAGKYSGELRQKVNDPDPAADKLAARIGGLSRAYFQNDPSKREFDAISDGYIAQAKPATITLGSRFRVQAQETFEAAKQTGRSVYYHFEGGEPRPDVRAKLEEYSRRYGVRLVIDTVPFN